MNICEKNEKINWKYPKFINETDKTVPYLKNGRHSKTIFNTKFRNLDNL